MRSHEFSFQTVKFNRLLDAYVLLMERQNPQGFWQSVTGSLKWGESAEHAALRELKEETGLSGSRYLSACLTVNQFPILPAWRNRYDPKVRVNTEYAFSCCFPVRRFIKLNDNEHRQYCWLPFRRAIRKMSSWTNQQVAQSILQGTL